MANGNTFPSPGKHQQLHSLAPLTMVVFAAKTPNVVIKIITGSVLYGQQVVKQYYVKSITSTVANIHDDLPCSNIDDA